MLTTMNLNLKKHIKLSKIYLYKIRIDNLVANIFGN